MKTLRNNKVSGSTLLEALVSVVVLSIGLLGIGLLQLQSKHLNFQAIQRSTASMLTNEIIERMRNNRDQLGNYLATVGGGALESEEDPECSVDNPCILQELAGYDLWQWEQSIDGAAETLGSDNAGGLSQATGCITGPAGGGSGLYTVSVAWRGQSTADSVSSNTCGTTTGKYDENSGDNAYRRLLAVNVFIAG